MSRRRGSVAAVARAGNGARSLLLAFLSPGSSTTSARVLDAFKGGMLELGYVEGSNIRYEYRFADGYLDRLPGLAVDLVRLKPDVILSTPLPVSHRTSSGDEHDPHRDGYWS